MNVTATEFGRLPSGEAAHLFTLDNGSGLTLSCTNYGGIVTSVRVPDADGRIDEVTLAHDTLDQFLSGHPYFGAFIGRYANRISGGGFELDGRRYELAQNAGNVHLHGGVHGFDKHLYYAETEEQADRVMVHLTRVSPNGEEGYPGRLRVRHTIGVAADMRIFFAFEAETDAATVLNLTNHTYWNLGEPKILDHELMIYADHVVAVDNGIPTGELLPIGGGPFDFSAWKAVRTDIEEAGRDGAGGYDHCMSVTGWDPHAPIVREAARVRSRKTRREMTVSTTYPGIQFYSGNNLPGVLGPDGSVLEGREALCLECQYFPDSPNRPNFPSTVLRPGDTYFHRTEHLFSTF